jgi:multiple sugar transport system substrate-binding protein
VQFYAYLDPTSAQAQQEKLLAGWHTLHPTIPVEIILQPGSTVDAITKLTTLVASGTPPDVLMDLGTGRNLSQLQLVQPLDALIGRDKYDMTQFNSKTLDYKSRFQGKTYMIPYETGGNAIGLFYNRQLFQQSGVAEPPDKWDLTWTWAQWVDNLTRLTKTGADGQVSQFGLGGYGYFIDYPIPYGGQWLTNDFTTIVCDSPETIQAYSDFADLLLKQHVTARPGEATTLFGKGDTFTMQKAAIASIGPWDIPTYVGGKAPGVDWTFMPFPKAKIATPDISPVALALVQGAKHRDDGWTLLKWLVQDSNLATFLQRPPAAQSDLASWAAKTFKDFPNSRWQVFVDGVPLAQPPDNILLHPKWSVMLKTVITPTFNQIWAGSKAVATAMREMKPTLQQLVDQT